MVGWHSILAEKKIWKQFIKTGLSRQYQASVFCLLYQKNFPNKQYFDTLNECSSSFSLRPRKLEMLIKSMGQ